MDILITTRFSIFDATLPRGWVLSRQAGDAEAYRATLYDPTRMRAKFACFEGLTVPSIRSQRLGRGITLRWNIVAGAAMPDGYRKRLERSVRGLACAHITWAGSMRDFREIVQAATQRMQTQRDRVFATVRLDDDDGLSPLYCQALARYAAAFRANRREPFIVSFVRGRQVQVDVEPRGNAAWFTQTGSVSHPSNAFGMAMVGGDVYAAGNHSTVRERYPIYFDETPDMWLAACNDSCDTGRRPITSLTGPRVRVVLSERSGTEGPGPAARSPKMAEPEPVHVAAAGSAEVAEPEPVHVMPAGPAEVAEPEPDHIMPAGPAEMVGPEPAHVATAGPAEMVGPEPVHVAAAGPAEMAEPEPVHVAAAGPAEVAEPEPVHVMPAGPAEMAEPELDHVATAGPPFRSEALPPRAQRQASLPIALSRRDRRMLRRLRGRGRRYGYMR